MRSFLIFLCSIALTVILCLPAQADRLRFGYDQYPPFSYSEDGKAKGESIEVVREACRRLGHEPEFVEISWARLLESAKDGTVDAVMVVFKTPERQRYLFFHDRSGRRDSIFLFANKAYGKTFRSMDDITSESVGAVRGYYYGDGVLEGLGDKVRYVKDNRTLYRMLAEGRFKLVLGNDIGAEYLFDELGVRSRIARQFEVESLYYYTAFSKAVGPRGRMLADLFGREIIAILKEWREQGRIR